MLSLIAETLRCRTVVGTRVFLGGRLHAAAKLLQPVFFWREVAWPAYVIDTSKIFSKSNKNELNLEISIS